MALAMQFYRIELAEQRRMMGVMEHHSRESAVVSGWVHGGGGGIQGADLVDQPGGDKTAVEDDMKGTITTEAGGGGETTSETDSRTSMSASASTSETDATSFSDASVSTKGSVSGSERRRRIFGAMGGGSASGSGSANTSGSGSANVSGSGSGSGSAYLSAAGSSSGSGAKASGGGSESSGGKERHGRFPFSITAGVEKGSKNR